MTHTYAVRIPLSANANPAPTPRLFRMQEQGFQVSQPYQGIDAACSGTAGCLQNPDWAVVGLAFLQDRVAVLSRLGQSKDGFVSQTDLELMLALRTAGGPDFVQDIAGSFSLVFVDKRTGTFEACRDHLGIYPFYYTVHDGALTCASDLRACLHLSGTDLAVDPLRIADFIHGEDIDVDRTAFHSVSRLPPAHRLSNGPDGVKARPYWTLKMPPRYSGDDGPAKVHEALAEATMACVGADEKVGAMLSGGLDSSALVALAARDKARPLPTLSFVYGRDKAYDETPYIDAMNAKFETVPHKIPVEAGVALDDLRPVVEEQMDLFLAPGLPKSRRIYHEAHTLGLETLLDGHGGDEVVSHGFGRLVELAARRHFRHLSREARGAAKVHGVPHIALVASHIARYSGLRPGHPLRRVLMKSARLLSRRSLVSKWSGSAIDLIAPDLRISVDPQTRYAPNPLLKTKADYRRAADITHLHGLTDPLMVQAFEVLHRSATAAGILPRYPFFDHRVVLLCLSLPAEQKLRDGRSRWSLREAMKGVLPDRIRMRVDKAEFGSEVKETILAFYRDAQTDRFGPLAEFVDIASAERLCEQVTSGAVTDVDALRALWRLAVLLHWVSAFENWRDAQATGKLI